MICDKCHFAIAEYRIIWHWEDYTSDEELRCVVCMKEADYTNIEKLDRVNKASEKYNKISKPITRKRKT